MNTPIVHFTPFHPSRVPALRNWREKDLREPPAKSRKTKLKSTSPDSALKALIPSTLDPATQAMILQALKNRRK